VRSSRCRHSSGDRHARCIRVSPGEGEHPLVEVPIRSLPDSRLALEPAAVRLLDVVAARGEDVEDEAPAREQECVDGLERLDPVLVGLEVEQRAEGAGDEVDALRGRRSAQVAEPKLDEVGQAGVLRPRAAHGQHPLRVVDADHFDAGFCDRDGDSSGADA
jgi:hypothetical protein